MTKYGERRERIWTSSGRFSAGAASHRQSLSALPRRAPQTHLVDVACRDAAGEDATSAYEAASLERRPKWVQAPWSASLDDRFRNVTQIDSPICLKFFVLHLAPLILSVEVLMRTCTLAHLVARALRKASASRKE